MEHEPIQVRTDLAIEAKDMYVAQQERATEPTGVKAETKHLDGIKITHVTITEQGAQEIGKKPGTYITIYADGVKKQDTERQDKAAKIFSRELKELIEKHQIKKDQKGLVVGLGNWQVTPDALGPMTIEKIMVTNHLFMLDFETVADGYRPVAAVAPGVMGTTGMETSDLIHGIVKQLQPDFVIAVDALASRSIERVNETIQISDTGIHPGSGVGNKRKELSKETLGIPVISVGVPTVVDAVTIASDSIDLLLKHMGHEWREKDKPSKSLLPAGLSFGKKQYTEEDLPSPKERETFLGLVGNLSDAEKRQLITEVLTPLGHNMIVTPKEVDGFMKDMGTLLAKGINGALHESIDEEHISAYTR